MTICKKKVLLSILGVMLISFATPSSPFLCALAYFIGYPILMVLTFLLKGKKIRALFFYGCGVLYFLVQMFWLGSANYHGPFIVIGYLLLSLIFPLNFYLFAYLLPESAKELCLRKILFLSLVFTFLEYARLWFICGFPFHTSGLILSAHVIPLQLSSVVGLYGLTYIVIAWAQVSAKCFFEKNALKYVLIGSSPIFLGAFLFYFHDRNYIPGKAFSVVVIQTGLKVEQKMLFKGAEGSFVPITVQLKKIWEQIEPVATADLVVLPEVCLPGSSDLGRYTREKLKEIFSSDFLPFLDEGEMFSHKQVFAALSLYINTDIYMGLVEGESNSALYFSKGQVLGLYKKRRLLPLGEYIPFAFLRKVAAKYGIHAFFKPGVKKEILQAKMKILPTICFDEGFPGDFLAYKGPKADVHVNLTNDAWFFGSNLARSHHDIGVVRAVENGVYSIRSCNTGLSSFITPKGEVACSLKEVDEQGNPFSGALYHSFTADRLAPVFPLLGNFGWLSILLFFVAVLKVFSKKGILLRRLDKQAPS